MPFRIELVKLLRLDDREREGQNPLQDLYGSFAAKVDSSVDMSGGLQIVGDSLQQLPGE